MANDYFAYQSRSRRVASAGLDGLTPILLIAYVLAAIGGGIYMHVQLSDLIEQGRVPETFSTGVLWTAIIVNIVLLFAVTGPMVLLGVFIASKIIKFPLSGAAYLKACGVAALPVLMLTLARVLPRNVVLVLLVVVAIIPLTFFVMKNVFELNFGEGALAFVMSAITGLIGLVISGVIVAAVAAGGVMSNQVAKNTGGGTVPPIPGLTPGVTSPRPSPNVTPAGPTKSPLESLRETLATRAGRPSDESREAQQRELASLRSQATQIGATGDAEVARLLKDLEVRAAAAPSEAPEPSLFQPPAAATAWAPTEAQLALLAPDEVSFKQFNLRVPKDFRADLASSESDEKGLVFSGRGGDSGRIVLRTVALTNAKQRRPWVLIHGFQKAAAERDKLFYVDGVGAVVDEGTINGLAFTRIVHEPGKRWGVHGRSAQYVAHTPDGWLIVDAIASTGNPASLDLLEAAARTIRPRPAGDPKIDPFSTDSLAARLADDPDRIGQMLRLRGKAAEDAVIPLLKSDDARTARAAAAVLADVGTEKSVPALQEAARSSDSWLAEAARDALKKLKPDTMDAVAEALLDLETGTSHKKNDALAKLAKMTPAADDPRREKVAAAIENEILGKDLFFVYREAGPAMATWAGKNTVPRLLPLLEKDASSHQREVAMEVFAKLKDKRGVYPVVRWVLLDTDNATKALIEMGPVAEDEVIKLSKAPEAKARLAAARILQEIGTAKSLAALKRAANDPRDASAAAAARVAFDIVSERVKASKATAGGAGATTTTAPTR